VDARTGRLLKEHGIWNPVSELDNNELNGDSIDVLDDYQVCTISMWAKS